MSAPSLPKEDPRLAAVRNLSYTQLSTFEECAFRYQELYLSPQRVRTTGAAARKGHSIHEVAQELMTGVDNPLPPSELLLGDENSYQFLKRSLEAALFQDDHPHALWLEHELVVEWQDWSFDRLVTVALKAVLDVNRVYERGAAIDDYKTGRALENKVDDDPQGRLYGWVVCETFPDVEWVEFRQHQLAFRRSPQAWWSREDLMEYGSLIRSKVRALLNTEEFLPQPGNQCKWCDVAPRCPAAQKLLGPGLELALVTSPLMLVDDESTRQAARVWLQIKAAADQLQEALAARLANQEAYPEGTIELDGRQFGHSVASSLSIPSRALPFVQEVLARKGIDVFDNGVFQFNHSDHWKLYKPGRSMIPEIAEVAVPRTYKRKFGIVPKDKGGD